MSVELLHPRKAAAVNPLKMSAPLGAAMAFLGLDSCLPLFHGSQGCTAFALVAMVRHFREAIPLQTTAMNELTTILGGADHVEQAIGNIFERAKPRVIGLCTTGLTETRGEDMVGDLKLMRSRHPEWADLAVVFAPTPDYIGGLQEGWAAAVTAMVETLVPERRCAAVAKSQINILAGNHLTPGDIEEIRDIVDCFGLESIILPDLSGSLDGHVPERYIPHTLGGTRLEEIRAMGRSVHTVAVGEHMRGAAEALQARTGVPFTLLPHLTGLAANDALMALLAELANKPVPQRLRRQRSQLLDAMLDGHIPFGGQRIAIAAEPDLLLALGSLVSGLGASVDTAVTTVSAPHLSAMVAGRILVGDLDDFERATSGCDLLITHGQGVEISRRTGIPLFRAGFPIFDRLGAAHRVGVGYRGSRDLIFTIGNMLIDRHSQAHHQHREEEEDERTLDPQAAAG
ncbi:MAG: nitrogenase iron-molybdenum cofactor biosynthesis protein NifN [Rhodospirillaceae bacterium]